MIQFNLLPDVKLEYIRANRLKRLLISISILVAAACFAIAVLLFLAVNVVQKDNMNGLNKDIKATANTVKQTPDIDKIITIQNQLQSLPTLHSAKPAATRLFGYLSQVTPSNVTISNVSVDFTADTFTLTGQAADLFAVNTFVDTLKFTTYALASAGDTPKNAFSEVVLGGFATTDKDATYQVTMKYDPVIFDNQNAVILTVPKTVTTRSGSNQPSALFEQPTTKK